MGDPVRMVRPAVAGERPKVIRTSTEAVQIEILNGEAVAHVRRAQARDHLARWHGFILANPVPSPSRANPEDVAPTVVPPTPVASGTAIPTRDTLRGMSKADRIEAGRRYAVRGRTRMSDDELVEAILAAIGRGARGTG